MLVEHRLRSCISKSAVLVEIGTTLRSELILLSRIVRQSVLSNPWPAKVASGIGSKRGGVLVHDSRKRKSPDCNLSFF
jgi:hypothetical protein